MTDHKIVEWQKMLAKALTLEGSTGNIYNRFYNYSFNNRMWLMLQGVNEPVATYKKWQELGRQVKKGSRAKEIIRPIVITVKDEEEKDKIKEQFTAFKFVKCLFGFSDTDGEELPETVPVSWDKKKALKELKISQIKFEETDGNIQGYSLARKFAINPVAAYPFKTTMHELAHIILGHTEKQALCSNSGIGIKEFQAEATAHLLINELEYASEKNNSESRAYIQGWLKQDKPKDKDIRQVFSAVDKILKAGQ